jgi:hypothetical protein
MLLSFVMHAAWIRARRRLERQRETVNGKQSNAKTDITQIKSLREREKRRIQKRGGQLDHNNNNRRKKGCVGGFGMGRKGERCLTEKCGEVCVKKNHVKLSVIRERNVRPDGITHTGHHNDVAFSSDLHVEQRRGGTILL